MGPATVLWKSPQPLNALRTQVAGKAESLNSFRFVRKENLWKCGLILRGVLHQSQQKEEIIWEITLLADRSDTCSLLQFVVFFSGETTCKRQLNKQIWKRRNIKFKPASDQFQSQLREDETQKSSSVFAHRTFSWSVPLESLFLRVLLRFHAPFNTI